MKPYRMVSARLLQILVTLANRFLLKPKCLAAAWIRPWKTFLIAMLAPRKTSKLIWSCWISLMWTWWLCTFHPFPQWSHGLATTGLEGARWSGPSGRQWPNFTPRARPEPLACRTTAPAATSAWRPWTTWRCPWSTRQETARNLSTKDEICRNLMEFVHIVSHGGRRQKNCRKPFKQRGGNVCISCNLKAAHALLMTIVWSFVPHGNLVLPCAAHQFASWRLQVQFHLGMGTDPSGFVSYHRAKGIQLQAYSVLANSVTHHASHLTWCLGRLAAKATCGCAFLSHFQIGFSVWGIWGLICGCLPP